MAFDDDDDVTKAPQAAQSPEDAQETAEEALEDEAQDYRMFASLQRKNVSAQAIRKGEKDFESHGTRSQAGALEASRRAFEDVLGYTRVHRADRDYVRGWYFPERWESAGREFEEADREGVDDEKQLKIAREKAAERTEMHARDRTVCSSFQHRSLGRNIKGQGTQVAGWDKVWFLPEEALFLIERGTMDLWWPTVAIDEIFPVRRPGETDAEFEARSPEAREAADEYALGVPLSLQAAYALLVGYEGERGKVTLRDLQVFSNLNRAGFSMSRVPPPESIPPSPAFEDESSQQFSLWQRLLTLLLPRPASPPPCGPLVRPGLYRSYDPIYRQLALLPRHRPTAHPPAHPSATASSPFHIRYLVWKPGAAAWSKTRPPAPDYRLAIVDAHETSVPEGEELAALLASAPHDPPPATPARGHVVHARLKHGHRNVLVAVVDHGVTNYMRFGEGAFGEELLYKNFDPENRKSRGGKRGGGKFSRGGKGGGPRGGQRGGGAGGRGGRGGAAGGRGGRGGRS